MSISLKPQENQKTYTYDVKGARQAGLSDETIFNTIRDNTTLDFSQFKDLDNKSAILDSISTMQLTKKQTQAPKEADLIYNQALIAQERLNKNKSALARSGLSSNGLEITSNQKQNYADHLTIALNNVINKGTDRYITQYANDENEQDMQILLGMQGKKPSQFNDDEKRVYNNIRGTLNKAHDAINFLNTEENEAKQYIADLKGKMYVPQEARDEIQTERSKNPFYSTITQDAKEKKLKDALARANIIARKHGFIGAAIDTKNKDEIYFKDKHGNYHSTGSEAHFDNWSNMVLDNPIGTITLFTSFGAVPKVIKGSQIVAKSIQGAKRAKAAEIGVRAAGFGGIGGATIAGDYMYKQAISNESVKADELAHHFIHGFVGGAVISAGTDLAIAGYKGIKNQPEKIKDIINKVNVFDNESGAINRRLSNFKQDEIDSNYELFKKLQSDITIKKDIKPNGIIGDMIDTINKYNPLKSLSKSQESRERLMSAIFSNKELASEFANQITSKEAQIINRAAQRMGNDFSRLMKEYEQELLNEYVKSGKTNIDSIPKLYQELLNEIDKEAKARYKQSVSNLSSHLSDTDFKDTLLNSYIKMSDDAIQTLGMDNPLTATLLRETRKIEDKSFIGLNEAIELRKDINEILRNYDKQNSDLKKFKAHKHLEPLKQDIDNAIRTALDSKVAKSEMPNVILSDSEKSLNGSKRDVSPTAQQDNITSPQSLRGSVADEAIQKPLIQDFGENYPQFYHKPNEAIKHLLQTKSGQVQGAFYKEGLGDITIAWGNSKMGIQHIIERRTKDLVDKGINAAEAEKMAIEFVKSIPNIVQHGKIDKKQTRAFVDTETERALIALDYKGQDEKWVITAYKFKDDLNPAEPHQVKHNTDTSSVSRADADTPNPTTPTLTKQQADELFNEFINANLHYATTKEALNDKFAKAITKGMNKKDLDSRLTTEQWKQRVLDTNWGDSIKGLDNTIFKGFSPRMQEHTQMLFVFRALDRSVKGVQDNRVIDFEKLLGDLDSLEKLTLHPKVYAPLNLFREYAKVYRFSQELNNARGLESGVGGGALATTLEGRAKVFLTNRLFKKIFARIPYLGDNAALMNALSSAIGELKYPREISLKTLDLFKKHDEGINPSANPHSQNLESNLDKSTPLSNIPRDTSNIRLATQDLENDIKAFSNDKDIITSEYKARYETQANATKQEIQTKGYATKEYLQEVFNDNDRYVMPNALKDDVKLKEAILDSIHENSIIYTPKNANIITKYNDETYITTINESGYVFTQISGKENVKPTSYMQLKELEKETQDIENQALKMIDKGMEKEKQRVESGESEKVIESNLNKEADLPSSLQGEAKAIHSPNAKVDLQLPQEIKNIIDSSPQKGRDMVVIGSENFTSEVVKYAQETNKKVAIEKLGKEEAEKLGYKYPDDVRVTIDSSAINHTLNRHGKDSNLVKQSGQKAVDYEDIAQWRKYSKEADESVLGKDELNQDVIISFKQINGHAVIVESIRKKTNELAFKSMYFERGDYKKSGVYKNAMESQEANHSPAPRGYEPRADDSTPSVKTDNTDSTTKPQTTQDITLYANPSYIGSGFTGGVIAGIETDENGNITGFNPAKFAAGFLGGVVGHKAVASGFKYIKQNPQLKEAVARELADTLYKGFEHARAKYPIMRLVEPCYIIQNERGRVVQAKSMLKEAEGKAAYQQREQTKELLSALVGKDIVNQNDGRVAQISRKNIAKMTSDKAISKSVDNGFSELEHFAAVQDIERLYQNAVLKETHKDIKSEAQNVLIHRYNAKLDNNTNALITLKESLKNDKGNRIYSLELEALELKASAPDPQGSETMSRNTGHAEPVTPTESPKGIIPQEAQKEILNIQEKFNFNPQKAKDLYEWHKESHSITKDEQGLPKVFYHGSRIENLEIFEKQAGGSGYGFWLTSNQNEAKAYQKIDSDKYLVQSFINAKKPFMADITQNRKQEIKNIFGDDLTDDIWNRFQAVKKEFEAAKKQIKRKGYELADIEHNYVNLKNKDGNFVEFKEFPYSTPTTLLDSYALKKMGLTKIASFVDEKSKYYLKNAKFATSDIDLLMDILNKTDYSNNKDYLQSKLIKAGYDSIQQNDDIIVVFNSNQIKSIDNKGIDTGKGHKYFNESSPNIMHSNQHIGTGIVGGIANGIEQDENGNITGFNPAKFAAGFLGGVVAGKALMSGRYAIMRRMDAKKNDKKLYNVFKAIDSSPKFGAKMNLIGRENLNADTLAYALARNKRIGINKLDENLARELGFKYPHDVRRTIEPEAIIHTLKRHGEDSNLVKHSGQKAVTLDEIAKYQDYADNAKYSGTSFDRNQGSVKVSASQIDNEFYVIIEQIKKGQNELGYKTMYFERGILDEEKFKKFLKDKER